jgi:ATP-dependent RNA helicase DeaD
MKFKEMGVNDRTIAALESMGYVDATEVQEKSIPLILQGEELVVRSQTGTGKTAAFGIGIIDIIATDKTKKALVLAPTRELALQITKELRAIAKNQHMNIFAVYGGQDIHGQERLIRQGFEIIIATPGRLLDHYKRGNLELSEFNLVVLDEADRMLDMGFKEDIDSILDKVNEQRQMMLFSATIDNRVKVIANSYMNAPVLVEAGSEGKVETIEEETVHLTRAEKYRKLREILSSGITTRTIIFVSTQRCAEYLCNRLNEDGINAKDLHGGKSQNQRERVMHAFKEGKFHILVATDVASRGLHIEDISHIINYDVANDPETHTHRIGRTGRMGKEGRAITFIETDAFAPRGRTSSHHGGYRGGSSQGHRGQRQHSHSGHSRSDSSGHFHSGHSGHSQSGHSHSQQGRSSNAPQQPYHRRRRSPRLF